jgi:hypothetical protein
LLKLTGTGLGVVAGVSLGLDVWIGSLSTHNDQSLVAPSSIAYYGAIVTYAAVGAFLVFRRPGNLVGWLLLSVGFFGGTDSLAADYARYGLFASPGSLPGATWSAWYAAWGFQPVLAVPAFLLVVYPDGHVLSRGWRPLRWAVALAPLIGIVPQMLAPDLEFGALNLRYPNPVGISGTEHLMHSIRDLVIPAIFLLLPLALLHLLIRFRRATPIQRLQLKWFVYSVLAAVALIGPLSSVPVFGHFSPSVGLALVPIAIVLAIQRYRLYDIDKIISRTIVYVLVVGLLLGTYLLVVLALSTLSPLGKDSPAIVALSTLVVAAAFRPLLDRTRKLVDRRFNRARYDTARTLESFSHRLRSEVELDSLSHDLLSVVALTMQPTNLSLWIRDTQIAVNRETA